MILVRIAPQLETKSPTEIRTLIKRTAQATLRMVEQTSAVDITIILTTDDEQRKLNREYRNIDASTDVLSFPSGETDPQTGRIYLGDILISWNVAVDQAKAVGHSTEDELRLLVIHGILHLTGFDHHSTKEQLQMWEMQRQALQATGGEIFVPTSLEDD